MRERHAADRLIGAEGRDVAAHEGVVRVDAHGPGPAERIHEGLEAHPVAGQPVAVAADQVRALLGAGGEAQLCGPPIW